MWVLADTQTTVFFHPKLCTAKRRPSFTTSASLAAQLPASLVLHVWTARSPVWMAATAPMVRWGGAVGAGQCLPGMAWIGGNQGLGESLFVE